MFNQETDLMKDQQILWEREDLWNLCEQMQETLDIDIRRQGLKENIGYCIEFLGLLDNLLASRHEALLERIIILLIAIEIVIGVVTLWR